jgi:hypothetical protein
MSPQFLLAQYFRKVNSLNNQYAILIYNKKKLSIERKYPSVLHVSPNVEDGSPIHCIMLELTYRNPHKSIKGLQVQPIAQVAFHCILFNLENPLSHCLALFPISLTISDHRLNSRLQKKIARAKVNLSM